MEYPKLSVTVRKGSTENIPIRMESGVWRYASIENIARSAPVRLKVPEHGILDGWRVAVMNVVRPRDLNAAHNPPWEEELRLADVVDPDHIEFNEINGSGFYPYTRSGEVAWREPIDLSQYNSARMNVRDKAGNLVANWTTDTGHLQLSSLHAAIWLRLQASDTEPLPVVPLTFDIELIRTNGDVERICDAGSTIIVLPENTTE